MIKVDNVSNLERMLLRNELDIAIIKYTPIYKRNCHLIYDTLFKEELYVLLNKNHPLASKKIINVCDLKGNRLITSDPKEYPFKMTKFVLREAGVKLDIHTHTNYSNLSMIFDLVGKGIGITFATAYVCRYCKRDDIVSIVLDGEYDYEVCAVQKTQTVENSSLVEFIEKFINNC
jgi:DNA-binding transcriptional LysR family regulator